MTTHNAVTTYIMTNVFPAIMANHISRMPRPKEVLIVVDESGSVVQEPYKDTESISLYETMKHTLILLSRLDSKNMTQIMLNSLSQIVPFALLSS